MKLFAQTWVQIWAKIAIAMAALAFTAASAAAQAPEPLARELARALVVSESALAEGGFMRAAGPFGAALAQGQARRIPLTLRAGQDYAILAVCERRCAAPDLRLLNSNEQIIAEGRPEADGAVVMYVRVGFTGAYDVEVRTPRGAGRECWHALNVYTR